MRKSTKSVLQTSMFLSAFSHRGSLRAQGIGKGGMRACVPILPKRAFFSSFTSPSNAILCQAFGQCRGGKKVGEQQKRQPHMLPCPQPPKVERSVYILFRGGSRGRVQGVRTPPWDDLRFSNTTGILQNKKRSVVYWCWTRARDECTPS